jgi:hypothetical protein
MAFTGIPPRPDDSSGTSWVFRPPPGWPVPPAGWQPPPGWRPDPAWPPAPADWDFWSRPRGRKPSRYSVLVKSIAGTLTLTATVAGAYFAFRSQPHSPTTAGWISQANAACERDIGPLQMSSFDAGLPTSDQTAGQNVSAGQLTARHVRDLIATEGTLSKINGDLAELPVPQDSREPAVQAVLRTGTALVGSLDRFSGAMQAALDSSSAVSAAQITTEVKDADGALVRQLAWEKAIQVLGLRNCPYWTAHPPSVAPTVAAPTAPAATPTAPQTGQVSSLTAGEQQLAARLSPNDLTNCVGRPDLETGDVVAAVNCQSVQFGPAERPLVVQFANAGGALAWFQDQTADFVNRDDCAAGYEVGTWDHDGLLEGPWGCAYTSNSDFRMVWVADASLIGVVADGSNGTTMYSWWTNWAYVVSSAG